MEPRELAIRGTAWAVLFVGLAAWEVAAARRPFATSRTRRWLGNLGLAAVDAVAVRLLFPAAAVGVAVVAAERGWGLLPRLGLPEWAAVVVSIAVLDLVVYLQHVLFHAVPALWRLHRVHHADVDLDLTTALRFHPVEILLSMGLKAAVVAAIGPPVLGVLLFEVLLNGTAMFNHANIRIPVGLDRWPRLIVVTPDVHRVHHSVHADERDRNYGFCFPWWDRTLGTYRAQPRDGHGGMTLGLDAFRESRWQSLPRLLWLPFVGRDRGTEQA